MTILPLVLAMMTSVSPVRDHTVLGTAIAARVDVELPLFKDDADKRKTSALLTAIFFREGSFGLRVEGDHVNGSPTSWCSAQINLSPGAKTREGWSGPELRDDPDKCVAVAMRLLRDSVHACPLAPVASYAVGGPGACSSPRGIRISKDRMALAARLLRDAVVTADLPPPLPFDTEPLNGAGSPHAGANRYATLSRRFEDAS